MHLYFKKRVFFPLVLLIFTIILLSGCSKPEPPELVLSEDSWHYGEVTPDQKPSHDFVIKNEGKEMLKIESVYSSCPCVIIELSKEEIKSGEEALLKTVFDPTGYEGDVKKLITIKSNDPKNSERIIEATITVLRIPNPDIELSEQTFNVGDIENEKDTTIRFTISNTGDTDLLIEEIILEDLFNHNIKTPLTIPPDEQYNAELYINTYQLKKGEFRKAIRIMTNDPQNSMLFLRIQGNVK